MRKLKAVIDNKNKATNDEIVENLEKRAEELEKELIEQYKFINKLRQEQKSINIVLIFAFVHILLFIYFLFI